ncbi:hypothetical protein KWI12_17420 [Citrobacter cronae]|uniref:hypothetical protein n=1 Tax=Citrobacter cronae TaxID=1748967 RepID=UPI0021D01507|nr:hypothetical protein [Citrobacter cronae]MCU6198642.1 hypothetical protein [Citrobacter cronae]
MKNMLRILGAGCLIVPCLTMAAGALSNETLPTVGHKPTLEIGLRINGGPNLISTDSNGMIHLSASAPELKVGDFIEFHGIYSDIDGDIESKTFTVGNDLTLSSYCPGEKHKKLMSEFYNGKRSTTRWSHAYTLQDREIGCLITFSKNYGESDDSQTTSTGIKYTPLPTKGNKTSISTSGITIGNVKSGLTP